MSVSTSLPPVELRELTDLVQSLAERVAVLEARHAPLDMIDFERFLDVNQRVQAFTEGIFPGHVHIEQSSDPESDERYFVVHASTDLQVAEILQLDGQWHRRLDEAAGDLACKYRLSLSVS
jgi:hypothetical protein